MAYNVLSLSAPARIEIQLIILQNFVARFGETFTPDDLCASGVDSVTLVLAGGEFTPDGLYGSCGDSVTPETGQFTANYIIYFLRRMACKAPSVTGSRTRHGVCGFSFLLNRSHREAEVHEFGLRHRPQVGHDN